MTTASESIREAFRPRRAGILETIVGTIGQVSTRRRLVGYLVRADLKKRGADTVLGNLWWIIDPLLTMLVYVILLAVIFQTKREAYPLFIFCAILPWKWFSSSIADAVTCITTRERIIKQVNFPKIVLPMSVAVGATASFVFGLIPLFAMLVLLYPQHLSVWVLALPAVAFVQFVFTLGATFLASALTVFYRDLGNVAGHFLRIWFYLSPALYGADTVDSVRKSDPVIYHLMTLNPFFTILNSYRDAVYYGSVPDLKGLGVVLAISFVMLLFSTMIFKRLEPAFAKIL